MYTYFFQVDFEPKDKNHFGIKAFSGNLHPPRIMYSSTIITHTFLSLLLFQLQDTTTAKDDSRLMRLRAQKRSLADSPLSETFFPSDNGLMPEGGSKNELTTASSGSIFLDESDPGQEQIQQSWLHQKPVETMLTACTTTTDESDRSILPSAKFQRRQTTVPNACPPEWKTQPGQQKMKLDGQDEGSVQTIPDTEEGPEREFHPPGELQKWNTYPNALELFRLFTFGRVANPNSVCDEFVGQSIPMCAPSSLSALESPAAVLAPTRFCKCVFYFDISFLRFVIFPPGWKRLAILNFFFSDGCYLA